MSCSHVFIRNATKHGLSSTYAGPYEVTKRNPKYFIIQLNNKPYTVSIDRCKPAYVEHSAELTSEIPVSHDSRSVVPEKTKSCISTRTRREIRLPVRFRD